MKDKKRRVIEYFCGVINRSPRVFLYFLEGKRQDLTSIFCYIGSERKGGLKVSGRRAYFIVFE